MVKEINSFSKWFKIVFFCVFVIYIFAWLFTIHFSGIQKNNNLEPILPIVPQDSEEYGSLAESIIQNHIFSSGGEINTLRAPGYPFFVATFKMIGNSYFVVTLAQIFLVFSSVIIIRRLGALFHSHKVGEVASTIFLLNPLVLTLSLIILTDILFLFLFLFGFYLAFSSHYSKSKIIFTSIIFALAIYVRPMGVFALPIFVAPFLASKLSISEKLKSIIIMIFIVLVAVSPWIYRNYKLTGVADFTSFKAINLADYAVPLFLSNQNNTTLAEERVNLENEIGLTRGQWSDLRFSKQVSSVAQKIILEHPFDYMKYHIFSSLPFIFSSSIQDTIITYKEAMHIQNQFIKTGAINHLVSREWRLFFESITSIWWKIGERMFWLVVYIVGIGVVWKERKRKMTWAFIFIPIYLMILAGPAANARYAIQGLPFVLILFSNALFYILNHKK